MKLIGVLKWERTHVAVALVFANDASDLGLELDGLTLADGSLAYTGAGSRHVLTDGAWVAL